MGLTRCNDCGREVSDRAPTCPGCGGPMPTSASQPLLSKPTAKPPPASEAKKSDGGGAGATIGIGIVIVIVLCMGLPVIGILAAIAIPNFVAMQYRAKRAEVPANVDGIKNAEMNYDAAFDEFIPARPAPRPSHVLGKNAVRWTGSQGFDKLGWAPDGEVRGTYQVDTLGCCDFIVTGMIDVDGDGNPAIYTATKSINTVMVTPNSVY